LILFENVFEVDDLNVVTRLTVVDEGEGLVNDLNGIVLLKRCDLIVLLNVELLYVCGLIDVIRFGFDNCLCICLLLVTVLVQLFAGIVACFLNLL
jgi:hypothetical protein